MGKIYQHQSMGDRINNKKTNAFQTNAFQTNTISKIWRLLSPQFGTAAHNVYKRLQTFVSWLTAEVFIKLEVFIELEVFIKFEVFIEFEVFNDLNWSRNLYLS